MLQWLVSSDRPLRLEELAGVIAIDVHSSSRFDVERRFLEKRDALKICSSLVTTVDVASDQFSGGESHTEIKLALRSRLPTTGSFYPGTLLIFTSSVVLYIAGWITEGHESFD